MYSQDLPLDAFDLPPEAVRARFAWAERQGVPRWLWPDTAPDAWSAVLARIEAILRAVLTGEDAPPLEGDPAALDIAAYTSGTGPLLGVWLEQGRIAASDAAAAMLAYHLRHNRLRMQRLTAEAVTLCRALGRAGVAPVLVKGMHTAHRYFPEPGARPASDIDLVVPLDRLGDVEAVLRGEAYLPGEMVIGPPRQQEWRAADACALPRTLCFVHRDDPWAIDVQTAFDRRFASGGATVRMDKAIRDAGTQAWPVEGSAQVLRQPWLLLYLAVHASNGFENLTLLRLAELALVARADAVDWDACVAAAEDAGALGLIYPALHLCEKLAPGTVPAQVGQASRRAAPEKACRFIEGLAPASAHRLLQPPSAEKFLWSPSRTARGTQVLREILPREARSVGDLARIYRRRAWKLARGTLFS
jgi:hypothetical protein